MLDVFVYLIIWQADLLSINTVASDLGSSWRLKVRPCPGQGCRLNWDSSIGCIQLLKLDLVQPALEMQIHWWQARLTSSDLQKPQMLLSLKLFPIIFTDMPTPNIPCKWFTAHQRYQSLVKAVIFVGHHMGLPDDHRTRQKLFCIVSVKAISSSQEINARLMQKKYASHLCKAADHYDWLGLA